MRKIFIYGQHVRVKVPKRHAFVGSVYHDDEGRLPGQMRRIYVNTPTGAGVSYPVCYVTAAKKGA